MGSEHGQVLVLLTDVCGKNEITYLALHQLPEISDTKHSKVYQLRTTVTTRSTWLFIIFIIIQIQALK